MLEGEVKYERCVVVSQPMYFPWLGILEQIRLCDTFVYYDDVQYARGFFNRVQIKTQSGIRWLTVPLLDWHRGQLINEVRIDNSTDWKRSHRDQLKQAYAEAPFKDSMLNLVDEVFSCDYDVIGDLAQASTDALVRSFSPIAQNKPFLRSSSMGIEGASSKRLIDICVSLKADCYLTGHGARKYLEHEHFETQGIDVAYIDYGLTEYPQLHGPFTPYVSTLDMIANCGVSGLTHIRGKSIPWRGFLLTSGSNK
jgi:hypothetical protein